MGYLVLLVVSATVGLLLSLLAIELWIALLPAKILRSHLGSHSERSERGRVHKWRNAGHEATNDEDSTGQQRGSVAVLVPAHNEGRDIRRTLACLRAQCQTGDRILVVADNCTDDTANVARAEGVEVIERDNSHQRGKGYALDFGIQHLREEPPDLVVICDADCTLEPGSLEALSAQVTASALPAQGLYLMRPPLQPGPESSVSTFAFLVKNWVRPRAMDRMGRPVLLTGSGMAFPWGIISGVQLASGEIVEDLALGLELSRRGLGPRFCEAAVIWSELPSNPDAAVAQRTRWEHGYLASILRDVPKLIWTSVVKLRPGLLVIALDLAIPPLALLVLMAVVVASACFFVGWLRGLWLPFGLVFVPGVACAVGLLVAWVAFARELVPLRVISSIPWYILRKLNIYQRFLTKRQKEWIRTERAK